MTQPDRSHLELRSPEPEPPKADRRGDWGCSVFAVAVLLAVVVAGCTVGVGNATPSAAPENRMGDAAGHTLAGAAGAAQGQRGAPHAVFVWWLA